MKLSNIALSVVVILLTFAGCSKKSGKMNNEKGMTQSTSMSGTNEATAENNTFSADLAGTNEVPTAVQSNASGNAYFKVNSDSTEIYYTVDLAKADSVIMSHIHYGTSSDNGPIAVWLYPQSQSPSLMAGPINGKLVQGVIADSSLTGPMKGKSVLDLIHAIEHDSAYVQVHTKAHPEGELRGQVMMK